MSVWAWRCSGAVCAKLAGGPAVRQPCGDTRSGVGRCVCWQRSVLSCPCTCQLALAACFLWAGALENCAVGSLAVSAHVKSCWSVLFISGYLSVCVVSAKKWNALMRVCTLYHCLMCIVKYFCTWLSVRWLCCLPCGKLLSWRCLL